MGCLFICLVGGFWVCFVVFGFGCLGSVWLWGFWWVCCLGFVYAGFFGLLVGLAYVGGFYSFAVCVVGCFFVLFLFFIWFGLISFCLGFFVVLVWVFL